jgi:hypothetical protein
MTSKASRIASKPFQHKRAQHDDDPAKQPARIRAHAATLNERAADFISLEKLGLIIV